MLHQAALEAVEPRRGKAEVTVGAQDPQSAVCAGWRYCSRAERAGFFHVTHPLERNVMSDQIIRRVLEICLFSEL
jgi:hypothetical protein